MDVRYTECARDQLLLMSDANRTRILGKMRFFADQPVPLRHAKHLVGHDAYRFRIGDYRVVCRDIDGILVVLLIDKRDGIYKRL